MVDRICRNYTLICHIILCVFEHSLFVRACVRVCVSVQICAALFFSIYVCVVPSLVRKKSKYKPNIFRSDFVHIQIRSSCNYYLLFTIKWFAALIIWNQQTSLACNQDSCNQFVHQSKNGWRTNCQIKSVYIYSIYAIELVEVHMHICCGLKCSIARTYSAYTDANVMPYF